jgi:hypothetical protein
VTTVARCNDLRLEADTKFEDERTAYTWGGIWTGISVAGFATSIIAAVAMDSGDEDEDEGAVHWNVVAKPGLTAATLSGTF